VSNLVLGIDEAGRGPALGAMVLAAVALAPQASRRLSRAGVADSKSFGAGPDAHEARVEMMHRIRESAAFIAIEVCDVESLPVGVGYARAYSRFGTMFFASPVAALRNVRRSLAPGSGLRSCIAACVYSRPT